MTSDLAAMAAAIKTVPTLDQVDAMLRILATSPPDTKLNTLIDELLDYRSLLLIGAT